MISMAQDGGKMDTQAELRIVRAAYAKQVLAAAGVDDARLAQAFAAIPRETLSVPVRGW
jgi:protein-L-isoaspartate(D-aspartate) O-methyltransferase